jgi:hypothetical protein
VSTGGTPGQSNSTEEDCYEPEEEEEEEEEENYEKSEYNITLNEILPNPKGDERKGEFIEIYNGEKFKVNLEEWILKDASKTKFVFPKGYSVKPGGYLVVYRDVFKFAMNNTGKESVYLMDPGGNIISSVSYEGAKENVSYNFNGKTWKWSRFLTPGKENKFNSAPEIKIEKIKDAYIGTPVLFSAEAKDKDKDELKFVWNFGDGKRSYLQEVFHTYLKKGKFNVSLSVDDGSEKTTKAFTLEIKKYPAFDVEITRLLPNPAGPDAGNEWIEVINNEKKKVNLKGWKVATGSENLVNHIIADDFEIDPGKTRLLTRQNAFFYLNNKAMKLELRYPSGEAADAVSYERDKPAAEDEIYQKTSGGWIWVLPEIEEVVGFSPGTAEALDGEIFTDDSSSFLGGRSLAREKNYRLVLLNYVMDENLAKLLAQGEGKVLGAEISKDEKNLLHFTQPVPQNHYAVRFFKNTFNFINYWMNILINTFH